MSGKRSRDSPQSSPTSTKSLKTYKGSALPVENLQKSDINQTLGAQGIDKSCRITTSSEAQKMNQSDKESLLQSFEQMLTTQLEEKIDKSVRKIFVEELDSRVSKLPSVEDFKTLEKKIDEQGIESINQNAKIKRCEDRLEKLDKKDKRNNLIFTNVVCNQGPIIAANFVMKELLRIEPKDFQITNAFVLKKFQNNLSTILVRFSEEGMVHRVFKNIKNLRESKIGVEHDLTEREQQNKRKLIILKKQLLLINKENRVNVFDNSIKIEGIVFRMLNGKLEAKNKDTDVITFFQDKYTMNVVEFLDQTQID